MAHSAVNNLGTAESLGREFQRSHHSWPRWMAAQFTRARLLKFGRKCAVAIVIAVVIRQSIATPMYAASNGLAPEVPQGSRVLAWRLSSDFRPGDVVVYDDNGRNFLGRVVEADDYVLKVSRTGTPVETVARQRLVGRVVPSTR